MQEGLSWLVAGLVVDRWQRPAQACRGADQARAAVGLSRPLLSPGLSWHLPHLLLWDAVRKEGSLGPCCSVASCLLKRESCPGKIPHSRPQQPGPAEVNGPVPQVLFVPGKGFPGAQGEPGSACSITGSGCM